MSLFVSSSAQPLFLFGREWILGLRLGVLARPKIVCDRLGLFLLDISSEIISNSSIGSVGSDMNAAKASSSAPSAPSLAAETPQEQERMAKASSSAPSAPSLLHISRVGLAAAAEVLSVCWFYVPPLRA